MLAMSPLRPSPPYAAGEFIIDDTACHHPSERGRGWGGLSGIKRQVGRQRQRVSLVATDAWAIPARSSLASLASLARWQLDAPV